MEPARPALGPLFFAAVIAWAAVVACEQLMWWHYVGSAYVQPKEWWALVPLALLLTIVVVKRAATKPSAPPSVGKPTKPSAPPSAGKPTKPSAPPSAGKLAKPLAPPKRGSCHRREAAATEGVTAARSRFPWRSAALIAVVCAAACICSLLYWNAWEQDVLAVQAAFQGGSQVVELTSDAATRDYGQVSTANITLAGRSVSLRILWPDDAEPRSAGHAVVVAGALSVPEDDAGGRWNHQNGYVGMVAASNIEDAGYANGLRGLVTPFRDTAFSRIESLGGDAGGLLAGVLLGNTTLYAGTDLEQAFRTTGLAHLMAVSGSHLAVVGMLLGWLLAQSPLGRRSRLVALGTVLVLYVALTCFAPSAVRSCVMCLAGLVAGVARRRRHTVGALSLAVLAFVLLAPSIAFSVGFQLSVLAVFGLVLFARLLGAWLACLLPRRLKKLAEPLSATLAASFPTLPVTVPLFAQLPLVNPAATLAASPLFTAILALGLSGVVLAALVEPAGMLLLQLAGAVAQATSALVRVFAGLPLACVPLEGSAQVMGAICVVLLALLWALWPLPEGKASDRSFVFPLSGGAAQAAHCAAGAERVMSGTLTFRKGKFTQTLRRLAVPALLFAVPVAALLVYGLGGVVGALNSVVPQVQSSAQLVMLDVGQGDAFLIRDGAAAVLIDTGEDATVLKRELAKCGVTRLDAVVVTHKDADHCGALAELAGVVRVDHVYVHADLLSYEGEADVLEAASWVTFGVGAEGLRMGSQLNIGTFTLALLAPEDGGESGNDDSLVTLLEYDPEGDGQANARGLFSGDAEAEALRAVVPSVGDVDVVKVPHHGSSGAFTAAELATLRPEIALVSVGVDNSYGHPTASTLGLLEECGAQVYRSDLQGTVTVNFTPTTLNVSCEK